MFTCQDAEADARLRTGSSETRCRLTNGLSVIRCLTPSIEKRGCNDRLREALYVSTGALSCVAYEIAVVRKLVYQVGKLRRIPFLDNPSAVGDYEWNVAGG